MSGTNYNSIMDRDSEDYNILVIGKSGNGKSAVCNTLVGEEKFALGRSMTTTTFTAQSEHVQIGDCRVKVIDTPDVTNCKMNERQRQDEVEKWRQMTSGQPTAVLLTVRCDVRYTAEEYEVYQEILKLWGNKEVLRKRLVVAFTFGDRLDEDIRLVVNDPPPELKKVLQTAEKRYMVFTNKASADRNAQAHQLLDIALWMATAKAANGSSFLCCR